jgi:hypothetical protein
VTYFPPSNFSKSKNKNIYIIIANVYYKDAEPEVNINIIMKRKEYIFKYF